jgi:phosphoenolpyruvate carboxykinase (ATP)
MPIQVSRALLQAAIAGRFDGADYEKDHIWGLDVPVSGPAETLPYLHPIENWKDDVAFWTSAQSLIDQINPKLMELDLADTLGISNDQLQ